MLDQIKNNISNSISSKYNEILLDLEKIFEKIKKDLYIMIFHLYILKK